MSFGGYDFETNILKQKGINRIRIIAGSWILFLNLTADNMRLCAQSAPKNLKIVLLLHPPPPPSEKWIDAPDDCMCMFQNKSWSYEFAIAMCNNWLEIDSSVLVLVRNYCFIYLPIIKQPQSSMPEIVFISGCSSGIGLATARLLAHDPLKRFLVYATILKPLSEEKDFQEAAGSVLNETLFPLQMDVTKDEMIKSAISGVMQKHNRIDILSK